MLAPHLPAEAEQIRARIAASGVGLAGIDGCWWLPAAAPFALPAALAAELHAVGTAIFTLFDLVTGLYGTPAGAQGGLDALLEYRVPAAIPRLAGPRPVLCVRPDFQLVPGGQQSAVDRRRSPGELPTARLAATELEICPSTHGYAHAMQLAYGLTTDLADAFAALLAGRELLFVSTTQWSEFLPEQLAFCRALAERGARARVLLDEPVEMLAARIRRGERWQPPMFGIATRPAGWDDDLLGRIRAQGYEQFLYPHTRTHRQSAVDQAPADCQPSTAITDKPLTEDALSWPAEVGDALVFRFGYFDCFSPAQLARMLAWQAHGATFLNPTSFILDSKAVLAALGLPAVRQRLDISTLAVLDACLPTTLLVQPSTMAQLRAEQPAWVIKYAGFDQGNQAWGGRSLRAGAQCTPAEWARLLDACLGLDWPVVAQRATPSAKIDITYYDSHGQAQTLRQGTTRLRSFFLRAQPGAPLAVAGTHLTVAGGGLRVSEGTDAVQAPVVFR